MLSACGYLSICSGVGFCAWLCFFSTLPVLRLQFKEQWCENGLGAVGREERAANGSIASQSS